MPITPTAAQVEQLMSSGLEGPVTMLNLLRFKDRADGVDQGVSGLEAYRRYGEAAAPFLAQVGGRLLMALEADGVVIGPEGSEWDMALIVEYPSLQNFMEMASNPEYLAIHEHRAAALADSRLIACRQAS